MFLAEGTLCHVAHGTPRRGHSVAVSGLDLLGIQGGLVEHAARGYPLSKARRHSQVNLRGHDVTQFVNCQRRVVGDNRLRNALLIPAPQRPADQIFPLAGGKFAQAVKATVDLLPIATSDVEVLLVVQPVDKRSRSTNSGWPPGFFERTAGQWHRTGLRRGKQGECEEREKLL